ncbi:hypothetical protein C0989_011918 [Termitomyces sp. Mn162]|nr:hypothetical protein C0989_011918 [Termitomyces sp. Mn162]
MDDDACGGLETTALLMDRVKMDRLCGEQTRQFWRTNSLVRTHLDIMSKYSPTPAELVLVSQIFNKVDTQKLGILTGDVAVKVFGGAKLSPTVLGEIWSIADEDNNGWLPRKGVAIALRLMGWAQKGETITPDLVHKRKYASLPRRGLDLMPPSLLAGPLPEIEGYSAVTQQVTGTSLAKSPPPSLPVLTVQEKVKFLNIFNKAGPDSNGLLNSTKARDIFLKSKLSNDTLLQIWLGALRA